MARDTAVASHTIPPDNCLPLRLGQQQQVRVAPRATDVKGQILGVVATRVMP